MNHRIGKSTILFSNPPHVHAWASIAGQKEGQGPLGHTFDAVMGKDDTYGEDSWEKAERKLYREAVEMAVAKGSMNVCDLNFLCGGDLLNQIISAAYAARELQIPFLGLYNACSTMAESLLIASVMIDGGYAQKAACCVSSHFSTAERQYRMPLELGNQRTPTAQWTVTGAGCTILSDTPKLNEPDITITRATIGTVTDYGVTDANNMGAAMAPAAYACLKTHLEDTATAPGDYDLIVTGDLGMVGQQLLRELMQRDGITLGNHYIDCGSEIFSPNQDVHAGGSGCGCSAVVLNGWLMEKLKKGEIRRMLFMATGALMSPTTAMQGDTIAGIAHAIVLESSAGKGA
jgi:stage V sporulation protein AD